MPESGAFGLKRRQKDHCPGQCAYSGALPGAELYLKVNFDKRLFRFCDCALCS